LGLLPPNVAAPRFAGDVLVCCSTSGKRKREEGGEGDRVAKHPIYSGNDGKGTEYQEQDV
jgi:hypothetical protein